ncbi:MAG: AarF/ABC1/UbiB kinase family protein [Pseudomonadota bacterium]
MTDQPRRPVPVPAGRLSRLARLGSLGAGVAGRMAVDGARQLGQGQRPAMRDLLLTPRNVTRVTEQLAQMRGAAMKVGQLISMDGGDVLPPELAQIMARLRADADFMPPAQLKTVLEANWPKGWLKAFRRFDVHPIAAASIGQVHRATLKDGTELAIKVQYPGVARSIDSDVTNVGALIRMSGLLPGGFDLGPYLEQAKRQLHDETDYALEGRHLARFATLLEGDDRFQVPRLVPEWTTENILAMTYLPGAEIETVAEAPQAMRDDVVFRLLDLTLRELFDFGLMQTDPNFANYRWNAEAGRIVLLDFGATLDIAPRTRDLYRRLLRAGLSGDAPEAERVAEEMGLLVPDMDPAFRARLLAMMETGFAALRRPGPFDFANDPLSRTLAAEGEALARDGFIPPPVPMDILYLQRKMGGMTLLAARLGARVSVADLMAPYLDG